VEPRPAAGIHVAGIHPVSTARAWARTSAFQTPMWLVSLASCEGDSLDAPSLSLEIRAMPWSDPRQGLAFETRPFSGASCRQRPMAGRDSAALRRPRWSGCQAQVASVVATETEVWRPGRRRGLHSTVSCQAWPVDCQHDQMPCLRSHQLSQGDRARPRRCDEPPGPVRLRWLRHGLHRSAGLERSGSRGWRRCTAGRAAGARGQHLRAGLTCARSVELPWLAPWSGVRLPAYLPRLSAVRRPGTHRWYAGNRPRWNRHCSEKWGRISPNAVVWFRNWLASQDPRQHWASGQWGRKSGAGFRNFPKAINPNFSAQCGYSTTAREAGIPIPRPRTLSRWSPSLVGHGPRQSASGVSA